LFILPSLSFCSWNNRCVASPQLNTYLKCIRGRPLEGAVFCHRDRHIFSGWVWGGGLHTPRNDLHPSRGIWHCPEKFLHPPANYIYFDLLPILWSQISPCMPRKQILLNFFLGLSGRCYKVPAKASSSTPPRYLSTPPRTKIRKSVFA
jgi:hypothetical protein